MDEPADTLDEREVRINNSKKVNITPIFFCCLCLPQFIYWKRCYLKIRDKGVPFNCPTQLDQNLWKWNTVWIDLGSFTPRLLLNNQWRILIVRHVAAYCTLNIATALSQEGQSFAEQCSVIDMFSFSVKLTTFKTQHTRK